MRNIRTNCYQTKKGRITSALSVFFENTSIAFSLSPRNKTITSNQELVMYKEEVLKSDEYYILAIIGERIEE